MHALRLAPFALHKSTKGASPLLRVRTQYMNLLGSILWLTLSSNLYTLKLPTSRNKHINSQTHKQIKDLEQTSSTSECLHAQVATLSMHRCARFARCRLQRRKMWRMPFSVPHPDRNYFICYSGIDISKTNIKHQSLIIERITTAIENRDNTMWRLKPENGPDLYHEEDSMIVSTS